jgi:hypothetical protein
MLDEFIGDIDRSVPPPASRADTDRFSACTQRLSILR